MLIRNGGRDLGAVRDIKVLCRDFFRERGVSHLVFFGKTQVLFSAFFDPSSDEDFSIDFSTSPSVLWEEGNPFFQKQFAESALKKMVHVGINTEYFSVKGLSIECQVLQNDGGLSTAIALACYCTLSHFFQEECSVPFNKIVGVSCGLVKDGLVIDLDAQEFFQAESVIDFLFDEKGNILGIPFFFSRVKTGLSIERTLSMAQSSFSAVKGILGAYDAPKKLIDKEIIPYFEQDKDIVNF